MASPKDVDNVRWAPDGTLIAAGQGGTAPSQTSNVAKVDVTTMKSRELVRYPYNDTFSAGTVAIQVGREIWVGSQLSRDPLQLIEVDCLNKGCDPGGKHDLVGADFNGKAIDAPSR